MMKFIGKHLTIDMYGCRLEQLNDLDFIKSSMVSAIETAGMTLLDFTCHKFEPQGLTALALLSKSHMSIHTYPELGYAAIDIFTCSQHIKPEKAISVLKSLLKPERTKITNIKRGDFGSERDMKPKVKVSVTPLGRVRRTGARVLRLFSKPKVM